jgi:nicotinamidase-related amidase
VQHAFGLTIPEALDEVCDPRRSALIIYDMQTGIVPQLPDGHEVVARVLQVRQLAREAGLRVFYTRHMSLPNEVSGVSQLRTAMAWQRLMRVEDVKPRFLRGSSAFEITPELTPSACETIFDKLGMSAFVGTPLDMALRDCDINCFLIAGIALEVGIEPTVRHGLDLGYIPILVTDACGSRDKAAAERALAQLAFAGGSLQTDIKTLGAALRRRTASSSSSSS